MQNRPNTHGAVELLKNITRDPNYVQRLQEPQDSGVGKNWDGRFTMSKIPQYDAVNDRFCKFNMRKRGTNKGGAPKRSLLAGAMLPGGPQKPAWGVNAEGYTTMTRDHGGGPLPPVKAGLGQPDLLNPVGALPQAGVGLNATQGGSPTLDSVGLIPQGQTLEGVWAKSKQRIIKLWDELGVAEADRLAFAQHAMVNQTGESVAQMNDEIQRLLDRRNAAVSVEKGIEVREGFLYLLQELSERFSASAMDRERALRELNALIVPFRNSSLDTVDAILRWREVQKTAAPYLWKGVSYLFKMSSDIYFLTFSKLGQLLDFDIKSNPLLDPRKELDSVAGGKLPPIRRGKDSQRMKDLPRERIERAERALVDEVTRQQQLSLSRAAGGFQGGGAAGQDGNPVAYVEEETHLANLVREDQEKNQIMIEEDAWLVAHNNKQTAKDAEETASVKIQTIYRGFMARRLVKAKLIQRLAAIKMQTLTRQFLAKMHVQQAKKQMRAAKKIQALHRGVNTRTAIHEIRHRHHCAQKIQCLFRGHIARKIADMLRYIRVNAISIQRVYRGHRVRKAVRHFLTVERDTYATIIQKHWRSYLVRRNPCNNPRKVDKVIKLQAWARGNMDREFAKQMLLSRRAATRVQAWWRKVSAQLLVAALRRAKIDRGWEQRLHLAVVAVTKIQSIFRQFTAKKRCKSLHAARVTSLASEAAAQLERDEQRRQDAIVAEEINISKIQALARGAEGRRKVKMMKELNSCATEIQRVVRGRLGRMRAQDRHSEHIQELTAMSCVPSNMPSLIETTLLRLAAETPEREGRALGEEDTSTEKAYKMADTLADVSSVQADQTTERTPTKEDSQPTKETMDEVSGIESDHEGSSLVDGKEDETNDHHDPHPNHHEEEEIPQTDALSTTDLKNEESPSNIANPVADVSDVEVVATSPELDGVVAHLSLAAALDEKAEEEEQKKKQDQLDASNAVVAIASTKNALKTEFQQNAALKVTRFMRFAAGKATIDRIRRSRLRSAGFTSRDVRNQEALFSVRILENWFQARLSRLHFVHTRSIKKAHDIHGRKERRQEENYAAGLIQGAAKMFIGRKNATKDIKDLQARRAIVAQNHALDQEILTAAKTISEFLRTEVTKKKLHRSTVAAALAFQKEQEVKAKAEERQYAAHRIQMSVRTHLANSEVNSRRAESSSNVTKDAHTSTQALEFATSRIQGAFRGATSRAQVATKRDERASRTVGEEADAVAQEAAFETTAQDEQQEGNISPSHSQTNNNLAVPHQSALNKKHARRGSHDVQVGFDAEAREEHPHHDLPKDAELHSADEERLQERIRALETQLLETQQRQQAVVEAEVKKRVEEEVLKASPTKSDAQTQQMEYVDAVQLHVTNPHDDEVTEIERLDAPSTPSDAGFASPVVRSGRASPAPASGVEVAAAPPTPPAPSAENVDTENRVSEGADVVAVVAAPQSSEITGVPVEPVVLVSVPAPKAETEASLSPAEKKELDDGFKANPKAMKLMGGLQLKAKKKAAETPPTSHTKEEEEASLSPAEKKELDDGFKANPKAMQLMGGLQLKAKKKAASPSTTSIEAVPTAQAQNTTTAVLVELDEKEIAETVAAQEQRRQTFVAHKKAALKIQSAQRQAVARKTAHNRRVEVEGQRLQKMKQTEMELVAQAEEAQVMQVAQAEAQRTTKERKAAEILQRAYRSYDARFMLKWKRKERIEKRARAKVNEESDIKARAAMRIQCFFRQIISRRIVRDLKKQRLHDHQAKRDQESKEHRAAIAMQCCWRCYNARFELSCRQKRQAKQEQLVLDQKNATEQRILDQIAADESSRLELENNSRAALTMQLAWRGYNARFRKEELSRQRKMTNAKQVLGTTADLLQAVGRASVVRARLTREHRMVAEARLRMENEEVSRQHLASVVQPVGRGFMGRVNACNTAQVDAAGSAIENALNRALSLESEAEE